MTEDSARRLIVCMKPGCAIWVAGACTLTVLDGAVRVNGATLHPSSRQHHVINPPFDSLMLIDAPDIHLSGHVDALQPLKATMMRLSLDPTQLSCIIQTQSLPYFHQCLKDYDCRASGVIIERESLSVPGACIIRRNVTGTLAADWFLVDVDYSLLNSSTLQLTSDVQDAADDDDIADVDVESEMLSDEPEVEAEVVDSPIHPSGHDESITSTIDEDQDTVEPPVPQVAASVGPSMPNTRKFSRKCRMCSQLTTLHPSWTGAIDAVVGAQAAVDALQTSTSSPCSPVSVFVVGSKGSGKSTLNRFLTNALITRHASTFSPAVYLDFDLGQPEHTVPGVFSLSVVHEPLFTPSHIRVASDGCLRSEMMGVLPPAVVKYRRFVGSCSPKHDPEAAIVAGYDLIQHYRKEFSHLPLVANCHGWTKGAGYTLLQALLTYLQPTHFFSFTTVSDSAETVKIHVPGEEVLTPPPVAYQSPSATHSSAHAQRCISYSLPAWHQSSFAEEAATVPLEADAPPRAVRSPADLRALRWFTYFLCGLQAPQYAQRAELLAAGKKLPPDISALLQAKTAMIHKQLEHVTQQLLCDQRIARAPRVGWHSPAFLFSVAAVWRIPVAAVTILPSSSASNCSKSASEMPPQDIVGQLVGLCSSPTTDTSPAAVKCARYACLGVGYVVDLEEGDGTEGSEILRLIAPTSVEHMKDVNTLVSWTGAHDMPVQLLYSGSPLHDAFCTPASTLAHGNVGSTPSGTARKALQRGGGRG